ncbi:MAG: hypothetical protein UHS51_03585 [Atopobiaceae bacterium]|nr:hypothetical protein [Atopobiaceae bacterium]
MKLSNDFSNMRYDFSSLSKNRLRTFNMMMDEFDRINAQEDMQDGMLSDDALDMLAAAGPQNQQPSDLID